MIAGQVLDREYRNEEINISGGSEEFSDQESDMTHQIKTSIENIHVEPGQRILAVSDIHGHPDRLVQLLRQLHYSANDILVIVGDLIEKGPESLRVVQYVMDLARRHPVYVSMGNVDLGRIFMVDDDSSKGVADWAGFLHWAERTWGGSLFSEMLKSMGIPIDQAAGEKAAEYRSMMLEQFHEEMEFLWSRPTILTAGKYIFVHGGIPTEDVQSLAGTDPWPFLKNDDYYNQGYGFRDHIVVTGHWPTCLYRTDREDVSPLFDRERGILCIDGGNSLKRSGQLNGIVIPDSQADMEDISWTGYDGALQVEALESQEGRAAGIHIQYFESEVEPVSGDGDMGAWRQLSSRRIFSGPADWTYQDGKGRLHYDDYADTRLAVAPGDRLNVILRTGAGYYCKKDGCIGWYQGKARPVEERLVLQPEGPDRQEAHRLERELMVYELLERLHISYERIDHREANTMEACQTVEEALQGAVICKNLFLCNRQRTAFYLLMMPGNKVFKTKELSAQIGSSRLSFGEAVYMERYLHTSPGSVSVMGLMHDREHRVQLLIDRDILQGEFFGCHPCVNTSSLRLRLKDLLEVFLPAVGHEPLYVELDGEA